MLVSQLRRSIFSFSRFAKPIFRNILNPNELLLDTKPLLAQLKTSNAKLEKLQRTTSVTLFENFKLSRDLLDAVTTREQKISCFDNQNREYSATLNYKKDIKLDVEPVEIPVSGKINLKRHFTIDRGVINISEIILSDNQVRLVNLPNQVTAETIRSYFKQVAEIEDVSIEYCVLGLPAYAILTLKNIQEVQNVKSLVETSPLSDNDRTLQIKTSQNNERERITNRRVAINGLPQGKNPLDLLTQLSKFGRVLHFDFPQIVRRNASKHEIYAKYKNHDQLVKIRSQFKNGHFEEEYYPKPKDFVNQSENIQNFSKKYNEKSQAIEDKYLNRLQYAEQIIIYPDSDQKVLVESRGYCLVLFSCSEEAQNCFFHLQNQFEVDLVKDHEFNYDKKLKQELFRFIDNEAIKKETTDIKNLRDLSVLTQQRSQEMMKDIMVKLDDLADLRNYHLKNSPENISGYRAPDEFETDEEQKYPFISKTKRKRYVFQNPQGEEGEESQQDPDEGLTQQQKYIQQTFPHTIDRQGEIVRQFKKMKYRQMDEKHDPSKNENINQASLPDPSIVDRILITNEKRIKQAKVDKAKQGMQYKEESTRVGRTFSELAEIELFGKIVNRQPNKKKVKHTTKEGDIRFDYNPEREGVVRELNELKKYDIDEIVEAQNDMNYQIEKNYRQLLADEKNRIAEYMAENDGQLPEQYKQALGQYYNQKKQNNQIGNAQESGNTPPKARFSTMRQRPTYRSLTRTERNQQLLAYNRMIKQLVAQYFGIFDTNKFLNVKKTYELPTLNMKEIKFSDGQSFLTQEDLPRVLNFHCDQQAAQNHFRIYYQLEESFKSMPIGFRDDFYKIQKQTEDSAYIMLAEAGVVEETYEAPEFPQEVVKEMNLFEAKFGETYSVVQDAEENKFIVKSVRKEALFPLDQLEKLENMNLDLEELSEESNALYTELKSGIDQDKSLLQLLQGQNISNSQLDELLESMAAQSQIPVKVLKSMINLKQEHKPLINEDISFQLALEKKKLEREKLTSDTMIKGTENNDSLKKKDKNQFVVSQYRQL